MESQFDMGWLSDMVSEFGDSIWEQFEHPGFSSASQFIVSWESTKKPAFILHCRENTSIKKVANFIYELIKESQLGNEGTEESTFKMKPGYFHLSTVPHWPNSAPEEEATVEWTDRLKQIHVSVTKRKIDNLRADDRYPHKFIREQLRKSRAESLGEAA